MNRLRKLIFERWPGRFQQLLFWLFFGVVLMWPLVHMVWSAKEGFSPWRYGGWGMYAKIQPRSTIDVIIEGQNSRHLDELKRVEIDVAGIEVSEVLSFESAVRVFRRGELEMPAIELDDLLRLSDMKLQAKRFLRLNELQGLHNLLRILFEQLAKERDDLSVKVILTTPKLDIDAQVTREHLRRFRYFVGSDRLVEAAPYVKMPPAATM